MARWRRSGLGARQFAAREGVNARTLVWWRWKLADGREDARDHGRGGRRDHPAVRDEKGDVLAQVPIDFVELVTPVSAEPFEVEGAGRYRVRVPVRFEGAALARLLDVLEQR